MKASNLRRLRVTFPVATGNRHRSTTAVTPSLLPVDLVLIDALKHGSKGHPSLLSVHHIPPTLCPSYWMNSVTYENDLMNA
ncbi:hypothetical protein AAC387_Pa05g3698 [Persea americana]